MTIKINQFVPKYDFKQRALLFSYFLFLLFSVSSKKQNILKKITSTLINAYLNTQKKNKIKGNIITYMNIMNHK